MEIDISELVNYGKGHFSKTLEHMRTELVKIRAGRASVAMLDGIKVDYYGTPTPLSQVANLGTPDSKTISIQPWEKSMLGNIEQSIFAANLGLTPMNDGETVRITIPALTEERRKELVKHAKSEAEKAKVGIRSERQKMMDFIKKEVKEGYPEDAGKKKETEVDGLVKEFYNSVEELLKAKESDIMTV